MPNDSLTSPGTIFVVTSKLVSMIALMFVEFFNKIWNLSLVYLLEFHPQGSYFTVHIVKSFSLSSEFIALEFLRLERLYLVMFKHFHSSTIACVS